MLKNIYLQFIVALSFFSLTSCVTTSVNANATARPSPTLTQTTELETPIIESNNLQSNPTVVWKQLQSISLVKLKKTLSQTNEPHDIAWLKLAIISKQTGMNTNQLVNQLISWRKNYPSHPGNTLFSDDADLANLLNTPPPKHIALLLPLQGSFAAQGQIVRDGFLSAYYESLAKHHTPQTISFYDTSHAPTISVLYQKALAEGADLIIGPLTKDNVQQLSRQNDHPVPTLALNYTDTEIGLLPTNLYQFGLSPKDEAEQLAEKARQAGHSNALIIAPQDPWGQRIVKPLVEQWQALGGKVVDSYFYSSRVNLNHNIAKLLGVNPKNDRAQMQEDNDKLILEQQRRQDFDVIFLLASPEEGREIVPLLKYYYTDQIPIYSTSIIYSGALSPQKDYDLNGVIFCDIPWILNKTTNSPSNRLYAVGRDAQLLSRELPRLVQLPNFPIYAATGALTLSNNQQIHRRVPWTQMHAGHP